MVRVFGFIDIQKDFMNKDGALYVPNAESIKGNIKKLVNFAQECKLPIFFTQDQHDGSESEMVKNGGPFPLHCMKETTGAENIITAMGRYFDKQCYDVFDGKNGNKNIVKWLTDERVTEVWLAGVVGNICVEATAIGLRKLDIDVYIFENAVEWMDLENGIFCKGQDNKEQSIKRLHEMGCQLVQCKL